MSIVVVSCILSALTQRTWLLLSTYVLWKCIYSQSKHSMRRHQYSTVTLLVLLHSSMCRNFNIVPEIELCPANVSCLTLTQFASSNDSLNFNTTLIIHPGNHSLGVAISISNTSEFRMLGSNSPANSQTDTVIKCESRANFNFEVASNVFIRGLSFVGCGENSFGKVDQLKIDNSIFYGIEDSGTALVLKGVTSTTITSSIFKCFNGGSIHATASTISIIDSTFSDSGGGAGSQVISLDKCEVIISTTNFTNNSEVMYTAFSFLSMEDCIFDRNRVPRNISLSRVRPSLDKNYRGILVVVHSKLIMNNSIFHANEAIQSGGILVLNDARLDTNGNTVLLDNAAYEGIVVMINTTTTFNGSIEFRNNLGSLSILMSIVEFTSTVLFSNNTPSSHDDDVIRGGAVTVYFGTLHFVGPTATFTDNYAINGGALYAAESTVYIGSETTISNNSVLEVGGGIYLYRAALVFLSNANIESNCAAGGGGIYALSSTVVLTSSAESSTHSLTISNNTAELGGGLFLSTNAKLYTYHIDRRSHNITIILASNNAIFGGAIYVRDESNVAVCEAYSFTEQSRVSSECFFQVVDLYQESGTVQLYFESNTASESGPVLFGGLLDRCTVSTLLNFSIFDKDTGSSTTQLNGLPYLINVSNLVNADSIASKPVSICFCFDNEPTCGLHRLPVETQKGKNFTVSVIALDHTGHALKSAVISRVESHTGGLGEGQQSQLVQGRCTDLTLSVTSSIEHEEIVVYAQGPCVDAGPSHRTINVTFAECVCPIGFDVDPQETLVCKCVCSQSIADLIRSCTIETESLIKKDNFWIDYKDTNESRGFIISHLCPFDHCLPPADVSINLNVPNGADSQCANHRAGKLCGSCEQNHSHSIGQSGCVKCGHSWPLNTALITLASLTFGILLVTLILFLNFTVTVGTINGFIFSANVLNAIFPFPRECYQTYLISFLNLNIGLNVCIYDGFDAYIKTWLELGFAVYLIFIAAMVVVISRYSSRFARFIGKRNPVETLATLIFLSYAKFLQFAIKSLSYGVIKHPNNVSERVWLLDATIGYFDAKHAIMFAVAIVVLLEVLLYTLLLFFWQWLVRCPGWKVFSLIRNTKLYTFMEMYHIPCNRNHRYWIGLLLLIRIVVHFVAVFTSSSNSTSTHLAVISILTALLIIKNLSVKVYKKWPVDVLESILIANTIIWAAAASHALNTGNCYVATAATFTSTVVMATLFIGVVVYHVNHYILKCKWDIQQRLNKISVKVRQRFQRTVSSPDQQDATINLPSHLQHLNVDRFHSILRVLDPPKDSDYDQLHLQQLSEMRIEATEPMVKPVVQPTFSVLQTPCPTLERDGLPLDQLSQEQESDMITKLKDSDEPSSQ